MEQLGEVQIADDGRRLTSVASIDEMMGFLAPGDRGLRGDLWPGKLER
jgi:hypothetical protein